MKNKKLFTSESVSEGHPDKIADQVSDAILDEILKQDPNARVACETAVTTGLVLVFGEISTSAYVDIQSIVRKTINDIGYTDNEIGFDGDTCAVLTAIDEQSPDISMGVDDSIETKLDADQDELSKIGAGDQGLMFGYASNETPEYMPLPIILSSKLMKRIADLRHSNELSYLRPDAKAQVTIEYDENDKPMRVDTVVLSTQHNETVTMEMLNDDITNQVIKKVIPAELMDDETRILINPTGKFTIGGPKGDAGLTGRKIIVDTYGGVAHHGGGAFSGKDATKVDRSASYAARYIAKNMVAAGVADKIELQISYAIGVAHPVSLSIETYGTSDFSDSQIIDCINDLFDLRPAAIIETLDLQRPIYKQTAAYGHFGRNDLDLPWEKLDMVDDIKKYLSIN